MIWLLAGYMWLFIHRPFEIWPVLATIRLERSYMLFVLACWLVSQPFLPRWNRLHTAFGLFILVMLASWLASPYQAEGQGTVENYLKYAVFYMLLITTVRDEKRLRWVLVGYLAAMTLWMAHSLREYHCGNKVWAQGLIRLIPVGHTYDFNDFAGLIVCSLPFGWVLWHHWKAWWQRLPVLAYWAFSCYCIVMTSSRMGFVGMVLAVLLACLASPKRWRILPLLPVLMAIGWTVLPEGQKDRYYTLFDPEYKSVYGASPIGTYRSESFFQGLAFMEERPPLGYGPNGFRAIKGYMPHNLYGQLVAELGLAGVFAFGLIGVGVVQNALEAWRLVRRMRGSYDLFPWHTVMAMSGTFFLLAVMSWGFNFLFWHVWLWFGGFQAVALGCLKQQVAMAEAGEATEPKVQREGLARACI